MSLFDSKKEIIKIELTSYGKFLLSKGKFNPAYYAFFDDEVIYDSRFSELSESQNEIRTRVMDETPTSKPQITFVGVENRATKLIEVITNDVDKLKQQELQISSEKNYALSSPLGKSSYNSTYYPAWNINLLEGTLESAISFIDNTDSSMGTLQPIFRIPQINISQSYYNIQITKDAPTTLPDYYQIAEPYYNTPDDREYYYYVKENNLLLDISELNVDDLNKNFDIEVFIEEEKAMPGTNQLVKEWKQLMFSKEIVYIKDDILLDQPENLEVNNLQIDSKYVEHYLNILVDEEIELTPKQMAKIDIYAPTAVKPPFGVDC